LRFSRDFDETQAKALRLQLGIGPPLSLITLIFVRKSIKMAGTSNSSKDVCNFAEKTPQEGGNEHKD